MGGSCPPPPPKKIKTILLWNVVKTTLLSAIDVLDTDLERRFQNEYSALVQKISFQCHRLIEQVSIPPEKREFKYRFIQSYIAL